MTTHTINALAGLGEDELVDPVLAYFTFEAVGMIRIVAGHDSFVEDGKVTDVTAVGAIGAYGGTIGKQEKVGVRGDLIAAFGALEAVDMEE
jgi:hypothetical protein